MKYAEIHDAALRAKKAGEEFCIVVTFRNRLPTIHPVIIGRWARYECPGEMQGWFYVEGRGHWVYVKVNTEDLFAWSAKPRTRTGDVPRVIRVVGWNKFNAEVTG